MRNIQSIDCTEANTLSNLSYPGDGVFYNALSTLNVTITFSNLALINLVITEFSKEIPYLAFVGLYVLW